MNDNLVVKIPLGRIFTADGQSINMYNFQSGKWKRAIYNPAMVFDSVSLVGKDTFLTNNEVEGKIYSVSITSGQLEEVFDGYASIYLKTINKLVFYAALGNERKGMLYISDLNNIKDTAIVIDPNPTATLVQPVQISNTEFLYVSRRSGYYGVWHYDAITGISVEMHGLKDCELGTSFWKESTQQLFCSNKVGSPESGFLTSLDGLARTSVTFGHEKEAFMPVLYIEEYDLVLLQQVTFNKLLFFKGELYPVWLFNLSTGKKKKIDSNRFIGSRAIYLKQ